MTARMKHGLAVVVACAMLTGCSGGSSDAGKTTSTTTSTSTSSKTSSKTTSSTTTSASPTSNATYAGAPGVPEAAKYKTDAGAIAFAKHYVAEINRTGLNPQVNVLRALSLPSCKSCANYENNVAWLKSNGYHDSAPAATVRGASIAASNTVRVAVTQNATSVVDANGATIRSNPKVDANLIFALAWSPAGWRTETIKTEQGDGS